MPRAIRFVPRPGSLVEVTTRTVQSRLLLQPTLPLNLAILGVLGRAQRMFGMVIHSAVFLSNHYHLLLAPTDAEQLSRFMTFVNSNIAREVGRLVGWKEKFWGRRYQSIPVSDEAEAQVERIMYYLSHGPKEGLVETPLEWPGVHSARALLGDRKLEGIWFDRSAYYHAKRRTKAGQPIPSESEFKSVEVVELSPLPCFAHLDENAHRAVVEEMIGTVVAAAAAKREETDVMPLGAHRAQQQHPHQQPLCSKKSPAKRFHAFSTKVKLALYVAYAEFVAAFRAASEKLRRGDRHAMFPEGCFPPALPYCA